MALISRPFMTKELKERGAYTGLLITIGAFVLNGEIVTKNHLIALGKFGVMPVVIGNAIIHLMGQFSPQIKELHESGERGKENIKKLTKELALLITLIEAMLTQSNLIAIPVQLASTYALCEISDKINTRGLGNGLTNLFVLQLLKDIIAESRLLFASYSLVQLVQMAGLTLPTIALAMLYHNTQTELPIVSDNRSYFTTHQITSRVSITLKSEPKRMNTLPIRVAAAGTMPLMHALSLFMLTGLDQSWLLVYGAILVFMYVLETTQVINTHELSNKLKKLNIYISGIRPGAETKAFLNRVLTQAILIGIPLMLAMGLYPFLLCNAKIMYLAISVPFLVCETQNIARQVKSYNIDYTRGNRLCLTMNTN